MPEPTSSHPQVAEWLAHLRAQAVDIGPRGSSFFMLATHAKYCL